ncbi:UDP-4-amino-4,6-dideoxy-N-acetyl-beta-L-altrosamine transaminase [Rubritalea tangerina]|uniref:UDP-4-amino-4, 6-dideoxy-N-acetyl-beta-L-altrosamine transaminase n=1 Tax=Rubritalea tangerina TaxID=430798 RepID=A0ABW4ZAG1_9BACT
MIPYGKQNITESDIKAVIEVFSSDFLTCGPKVEEFEKAFAEYVGVKHAIAVSNGTAALHLALLVAGVGQGDRVITSPNTFLASANCAAFVGATPDFCDIDPDTYAMSFPALCDMWQSDVKAVIPVAYAGQSADMENIYAYAKQRGAVVIEDACHGTGGAIDRGGQSWKLGGHPWADMTTFSFHPVKTMTTGEGGMLVTNDDQYAAKARQLRTHGMTREESEFTGLGGESEAFDEKGPWYYEMHDLGYNYRITDMQCALGLSQLSRLDSFVRRRQEIVSLYNEQLEGVFCVQTPKQKSAKDDVSWHLYTLQIDFKKVGKSRTRVMSELRDEGIGSQVLYIPVYLQPWYREVYGYALGKCKAAENFYEKALSLPLFPAMSDGDVYHITAKLREILTA